MANSDREAVQEVIAQYIDGTFNGDGNVLRACFHPKAVMNGFFQGQLLLGGPEPFFEQIENNPSMADGGAPYKGEVTAIDVAGDVASVTLKETGFAGAMNFTNYFHLLKEEGEWKIVSKTFISE